LILQENL